MYMVSLQTHFLVSPPCKPSNLIRWCTWCHCKPTTCSTVPSIAPTIVFSPKKAYFVYLAEWDSIQYCVNSGRPWHSRDANNKCPISLHPKCPPTKKQNGRKVGPVPGWDSLKCGRSRDTDTYCKPIQTHKWLCGLVSHYRIDYHVRDHVHSKCVHDRMEWYCIITLCATKAPIFSTHS